MIGIVGGEPAKKEKPVVKLASITLVSVLGAGAVTLHGQRCAHQEPPVVVEPEPIPTMPTVPVPPPDLPPVEPPSVPCLAVRNMGRGRALPPEGRIVGGEIAPEKAYLFAAAFAYEYPMGLRQYCGGTVIEERWVLTAAHCLVAQNDHVLIGRHNWTDPVGEDIEVDMTLTHANYKNFDYDVALAKLSRPTEAPQVQLGPLEVTPDNAPIVTTIGWGATSEGGSGSLHLRHVHVPLQSDATCAKYSVNYTERMLCAGDIFAGGEDACQGDSGGPLLAWSVDRWFQVGIVSHGHGCARPGHPGYYTRVPGEIAGWIRACIAEHNE